MKPVRTEQRNGYDIRIRTLLVHDTHNAPVAAVPVAVGHAAFVQIARDGEIYVDWHLRRNYKRQRQSRRGRSAGAGLRSQAGGAPPV